MEEPSLASFPVSYQSPRFSPRASHRSGRETLASSRSCHSAKAGALRRDSPVPPIFPLTQKTPKGTHLLAPRALTQLRRYERLEDLSVSRGKLFRTIRITTVEHALTADCSMGAPWGSRRALPRGGTWHRRHARPEPLDVPPIVRTRRTRWPRLTPCAFA
jgi:hypothetical protein